MDSPGPSGDSAFSSAATPRGVTLAKSLWSFVTAITEQNPASTLSSNVPRLSEDGREKTMSLGLIAGIGLGAAVIVIVVAITLINKFAN